MKVLWFVMFDFLIFDLIDFDFFFFAHLSSESPDRESKARNQSD